MGVSVSEVLPVLSVALAIFAFYRSLKHDTKSDAADITMIVYKLETISDNVKDIKSDFKDMKSDVQELRDRMNGVENSCSNLEKRLDLVEERHD